MKYRNKKTGEVGEYLGYNKRTKYHTVALDGGGQKSATDSTFKRWWVQEDEKQVPASSKNTQKKKGTKKMAKKKISWDALKEQFTELNREVAVEFEKAGFPEEGFDWKSKTASVVITQDSFKKELSEAERTYVVHSNSLGFFHWENRPEIIADTPDGKTVKLDQKLKKGWIVEYCYMN